MSKVAMQRAGSGRRAIPGALLLMLLLTLPAGCGGEDPWAVQVWHQRTQLARSHQFWPGFSPAEIPLALYDGKLSWLFDHPDPPEEFQPWEGAEGAFFMEGRHQALVANTTGSIGGRLVTMLLQEDTLAAPSETAAVAVHEAFHAFQVMIHPDGWYPDETTLFVYPVAEEELLALRRAETEMLRRALTDLEADSLRARRWALSALHMRQLRERAQAEEVNEYDARLELAEGTAQYVENIVRQVPPARTVPDTSIPAEEIRRRGYAVGAAYCTLLDRYRPGWKGEVVVDSADAGGTAELPGRDSGEEPPDLVPLHALLAAELKRDTLQRLPYSRVDRARLRAGARREASRIRAGREALHEEVTAVPGWRLVVEADPGGPLWPRGFDPMNIRRLPGKALLHTRWVQLGASSGELEVMGREVVTLGRGDHPIFQGIKAVFIAGLEEQPVIESEGDTVRVRFANGRLAFADAHVEVEGMNVMVVLR